MLTAGEGHNNMEATTISPRRETLKTFALCAVSLSVCTTLYLLAMSTALVWVLGWIHTAGFLVIGLAAFTLTARRTTLTNKYHLVFLLPVLYVSGLVGIVLTWILSGAPEASTPFVREYATNYWYGIYGLPALMMWVCCVFRACLHTHIPHNSENRST